MGKVVGMTRDEMVKERNNSFAKIIEDLNGYEDKNLSCFKENNLYKFYPFVFDEINNTTEYKNEIIEWLFENDMNFYKALKENETIYIVMYLIKYKNEHKIEVVFNYETNIDIEGNYNELFFNDNARKNVYKYLDYQGKLEHYEF